MTAFTRLRDSKLQKVHDLRGSLDRLEELNDQTILSCVPEELRSVVGTPRFRKRLVLRRARQIVGADLFSPLLDAGETELLNGGAQAISTLCNRAGAHVLWRDVIRIVSREEREQLNAMLGLDIGEIIRRARKRSVELALSADDTRPLPDRIIREGALAWGCWLASRELFSARRLRAVTPSSITRLIAPSLPADAEMRERLRYIVDVELNALLGLSDDNSERAHDG